MTLTTTAPLDGSAGAPGHDWDPPPNVDPRRSAPTFRAADGPRTHALVGELAHGARPTAARAILLALVPAPASIAAVRRRLRRLDDATFAALVDRLVADRLVARYDDIEFDDVHYLRLTRAGWALLASGIEALTGASA